MEKKDNKGPYLVCVPLSTMTNWIMEFAKWSPDIKVLTYKGKPQSRKDTIYAATHSEFHVMITSYEYVIRDKGKKKKREKERKKEREKERKREREKERDRN